MTSYIVSTRALLSYGLKGQACRQLAKHEHNVDSCFAWGHQHASIISMMQCSPRAIHALQGLPRSAGDGQLQSINSLHRKQMLRNALSCVVHASAGLSGSCLRWPQWFMHLLASVVHASAGLRGSCICWPQWFMHLLDSVVHASAGLRGSCICWPHFGFDAADGVLSPEEG
eukprot:1151445-Pelagomonas_calceolata.AAC.9